MHFKSGKGHFPGTGIQSRQKQLYLSAVVATTLLAAIAPRAGPLGGTVSNLKHFLVSRGLPCKF